MSNLNSHQIAELLLSVPDSPLYFEHDDYDTRMGGIKIDHIGVWLLEYEPTPEEIEAARAEWERGRPARLAAKLAESREADAEQQVDF